MLGAATAAGAYLYYETFDNVQRQFEILSSLGQTIAPVLGPETSHSLAVFAAKIGLVPKENRPDDPVLRTRVLGKDFSNPIGEQGLAKGVDLPDQVQVEGSKLVCGDVTEGRTDWVWVQLLIKTVPISWVLRL